MEHSTLSQRLGTAQLAAGLWMLVAALVACVTWPGPNDVERIDLAAASLPVVGLVGIYLSITAMLHLATGARLRQGLGLDRRGILILFVDHLAVLTMVAWLSLRNPASPVYLTGSDTLLGTLVTGALVSLTAWLLLWFMLPTPWAGSAASSNRPGRFGQALPWLHLLVTLGMLYALWRLNLQPLMLVK